MLTEQDLINFETDLEAEFLAGHIRAPIHLSAGNTSQLIEIFKQIQPTDWVFSTHRSHLHALLHGIPAEWLKEQILLGRSMHINSKEHRFMTSSIVGGCVPIAVGLADGLERQGLQDKVWCFVGDMAASVGNFHDCLKYASNFDLPLYFVIECNGLATNTPTYETWGEKHEHHKQIHSKLWDNGGICEYCYERGCAHINVLGKWVDFK